MLNQVFQAACMILQWQNGLLMVFGVTLGVMLGSIPGLTGIMAIALLTPLTYFLQPVPSIVMLIGISKGAVYGGSIPAIVIRTPGTPAASATVLDGYELAKQGKSGKALKMALYASVMGDTTSDLILIMVAAPLAMIALMFGPPEYTMLIIFSLTIIGAVAGESLLKGLIAAGVGLLFSTIGLDPMMSSRRLCFGTLELDGGVALIPMMIGLFAASEVFRSVERRPTKGEAEFFIPEARSHDDKVVTRLEMRGCLKTIFRSSLIGTFLGAIPGIGNTVAAFVGYNEARRLSKDPEKFGKGSLEGVAAAEAANNAVCGSNLIPLLTLGVPGDLTAAVLLGVFMIHGLSPGPLLFKENITTIYAIFIGMILCNVFNLGIGGIFIRFVGYLVKVRKIVILPLVLVFCIVGSYAINASLFDVKVMLLFGLLGYMMEKLRFPLPPLLIAFILGPILERALRQSLIMSGGSVTIFFIRPIAVIFLILTILSLVGIFRQFRKRKLVTSPTAGDAGGEQC